MTPAPAPVAIETVDVLRVRDLPVDAADTLLSSYGLQLHRVDDDAPIPGSFWGEP